MDTIKGSLSGNSRKSLAARLDLILGGCTQHNHRIVELNDDRHGVMFEAQLQKRWRGDGEGGEQFPRAPNQPRPFLESKKGIT